jgi:uncharacterized OB-fold protein
VQAIRHIIATTDKCSAANFAQPSIIDLKIRLPIALTLNYYVQLLHKLKKGGGIMTTCNTCGKENLDGVKYCVYCGASPTKICKSCGKGNELEAKYCVYCGADSDSTESKAAAPVAAPVAAPTKPCGSCGKENLESAKYCVYCGTCQTKPCHGCGKENRVEAKYCVYCGASQTKLCGSCGKENPEDAKHCVFCGAVSNSEKVSWWGKFKSLLSF